MLPEIASSCLNILQCGDSLTMPLSLFFFFELSDTCSNLCKFMNGFVHAILQLANSVRNHSVQQNVVLCSVFYLSLRKQELASMQVILHYFYQHISKGSYQNFTIIQINEEKNMWVLKLSDLVNQFSLWRATWNNSKTKYASF